MSRTSATAVDQVDPRVPTSAVGWREPPAAVGEWLLANALPISIDPGASLDDLAPLRPAFAAARVIGLGEATHGTAEFFRLKHRLLRFLVTELGATAFAIEAFPAECLVVDDYVRYGIGDPRDAARMLYAGSFPWDTEEVVELIEWLRAYNKCAARPVGFYGFDVHGAASAVLLLRYLDRAGTDLPEVRAALAAVLSSVRVARFQSAPAEQRAAGLRRLDELIEWLAERRELLAGQDSEADRRAWLCAATIRQVASVPLPSDPLARMRGRERGQAAIVRALLELEGPDGRVVCWAHNGHVQRGCYYPGIPACGDYLGAALGDAYVVVGTAFGEGSFRAGDLDDPEYGRRAFTTGPAPDGSLEGALGRLGVDAAVVDLRTAPPAAAGWLAQPVPTRSVGGGFSAAPDAEQWLVAAPSACFDLIAYTRYSTPAAALPGPVETFSTPPPVQPRLVNPGFSEWTSADGPTGWTLALGYPPVSYRLDRVGAGTVRLHRPDGPWLGGLAHVTQTVDARNLVGRRIELRARAGAVAAAPGVDAELLIEAHAGGTRSRPLVEAHTPIHGATQDHVVTLDVPDTATTVTVGARLVGAGWLELAATEVVVDERLLPGER